MLSTWTVWEATTWLTGARPWNRLTSARQRHELDVLQLLERASRGGGRRDERLHTHQATSMACPHQADRLRSGQLPFRSRCQVLQSASRTSARTRRTA